MYKFEKVSAGETAALRKKYHHSLNDPRDGMWESFVDGGDHYLISHGSQISGYLVLNAENYLLQFYVEDKGLEADVFRKAIEILDIQGAYPATLESGFLSLCADHHETMEVNDIMYHCPPTAKPGKATLPEGSTWQLVGMEELEMAVEFAHDAIGADKGWLSGYYQDRISGEELYGLWINDIIIAAGECRHSPHFKDIVDLGMIVSNDYRRNGIGANVLVKLLEGCREKKQNAICSTGVDNVAAQKAIVKSGFIPYHRNLKIKF